MSAMGQQTRRGDSGPASRRQSSNNKPGDPKSAEQWKMPPGRTWLWFVGILLANYLLMRFLIPGPAAPVTVPYTLFKEEAGKGNVAAIYTQGESITGLFKTAATSPPKDEKSETASNETKQPRE